MLEKLEERNVASNLQAEPQTSPPSSDPRGVSEERSGRGSEGEEEAVLFLPEVQDGSHQRTDQR